MDDLSNLCHKKQLVDKGTNEGPGKDPLIHKLAYSLYGKTVIGIAVCVFVSFYLFFWLA